MAGHSHSANIRFRKDRVDAARGKLFSKLAREILSAAREGGGDPSANLRLRYAVERARKLSMPRDNIERAIKKGTGELEGESLEELVYEGYGPGGVAIMVDALTDNRNRTAPEIKHIFEKRGGKFAASGAVAYLFDRRGIFAVAREGAPDEDAMMELVLEAGAEDLVTHEDVYEITTAVGDFHKVGQALDAAEGVEVKQASIAWIPQNTVTVAEKDKAQQVLNLIADLEDHDDAQTVSSNYEIPDELLAELQA